MAQLGNGMATPKQAKGATGGTAGGKTPPVKTKPTTKTLKNAGKTGPVAKGKPQPNAAAKKKTGLKASAKALGAALLLGMAGVSAGCKSPDQTHVLLTTLAEGKARGHLVVTTGGQASAGQTVEFFLGAKGSTASFDGDINFAEADFSSVKPQGEGTAKEGT